ncbi:hypothetical protein F4677DRAFT_417449 [Hypoxylon crocopeplum]|nr:hypothetical protein F4677DRAFT_417449 [Hypoxylon crocopeplum]
MRLCKALLGRSASLGQRRKFPPCSYPRYFADRARKHDDPSQPSTEAGPDAAQLASDRDDAFKVNPENKTVETAVGDLPLSPVMDPTFWEATRRHQVPKAKPGKPQNSVERQLRANPFAKALATHVRMCAITRTRLPGFFLQDFGVVAHPETGTPWLIPQSLIPDVSHAGEEPDTKGIREAMEEASSEEIQEDAEANPQEQESDAALLTDDRRPYGPNSYALARQDLLSAFTTPGSGLEGRQRRFAGISPRYKSIAKTLVWRKDMDTYVLGLMQQDIVNELLYLSKLCADDERYYIVKCYGWDDVQYKHRGSVLWFGEPEEGADSKVASHQPGPFATFDIQTTDTHGGPVTTSVAVHNMPMLLGPEHAARVRGEAVILKDGSIFMLAGRRTVKLQMKLWKLQGYLADYRDMA